MSTRTFEELKDAVNNATRNSDAASLMECAEELHALATSEAEAVAHTARGLGFALGSNYPAALEHYHHALAMHEELGNRSGVARVTMNIGNVYRNSGDYHAALEHLHRALAMHQELGDRSGVARVTNGIGVVHYSTGNYPRRSSTITAPGNARGARRQQRRGTCHRQHRRRALSHRHLPLGAGALPPRSGNARAARRPQLRGTSYRQHRQRAPLHRQLPCGARALPPRAGNA
ncbi:MAG: tetratricopeptide repeat protein [Ignavibacteria bacterium]|nr:tetratricopeptide repeat protein [Ignavibacteria bacterium]